MCEHVLRPSRRARPRGHSYLWSPSSPAETLSLHGRLAHSRRTGDGLIKEGETAGVKATLWPEVKSGGSGPVGISESRGDPHATTDGLCANTPPEFRACTHYSFATAGRRLHLHEWNAPSQWTPRRTQTCYVCVCGLQLSHAHLSLRMYIWATEGVCDAAHVLVISANASKQYT